MTTITSLVQRLRTEIGDLGNSFVWQTTADGMTNRYEIPHAPVEGRTLVVQVDGVEIPDECAIEERTGILTFDEIPQSNSGILVAGTAYRYFTQDDLLTVVQTAFTEHTGTSTLPNGAPYVLSTLPAVEEYPVVVLAASMALQTLATDAAFDIDISAPDGVMIPRSQRYRQLMEMSAVRKQQYQELCAALNIGLFRMETFAVRRVSNRTNRLSPLYVPQEIDDRSMPTRIKVPIPTYGSQASPSTAARQDFYAKSGDNWDASLDFPMSLEGYNINAQIRFYNGALLRSMTIDVPDIPNGVLVLSLTGDETKGLPEKAQWDIELENIETGYRKTYLEGDFYTERDVTWSGDPRASGWRG